MKSVINSLRPIQGRQKSDQIKCVLRDLAIKIGPGAKLPTVRELCRLFDVAKVTLDIALFDLENEGVIDRRHGSGIYILDQSVGSAQNVINIRVVLDSGEGLLRSPFFVEALDELNQIAVQAQPLCRLSYQFHPFSGVHDSAAMDLLNEGECHGVLVIPFTHHCMDFLATWRPGRLPVVVFYRQVNSQAFSQIYVDQEAGGFRATEHLIRSGHRRIGMLSVLREYCAVATEQREAGYRRALAVAGIDFVPDLIARPSINEASIRNVCLQMLRRPDRPTALLIGGSDLLHPALQAVFESGLCIPEQLSIVTCDDVPEAAQHAPPLTVVKMPLQQGSRLALEQLVAEIQRPVTPPVVVGLEPELVVRGSCAMHQAGDGPLPNGSGGAVAEDSKRMVNA